MVLAADDVRPDLAAGLFFFCPEGLLFVPSAHRPESRYGEPACPEEDEERSVDGGNRGRAEEEEDKGNQCQLA